MMMLSLLFAANPTHTNISTKNDIASAEAVDVSATSTISQPDLTWSCSGTFSACGSVEIWPCTADTSSRPYSQEEDKISGVEVVVVAEEASSCQAPQTTTTTPKEEPSVTPSSPSSVQEPPLPAVAEGRQSHVVRFDLLVQVNVIRYDKEEHQQKLQTFYDISREFRANVAGRAMEYEFAGKCWEKAYGLEAADKVQAQREVQELMAPFQEQQRRLLLGRKL